MILMRVHTAIREQAEKMQPSAAGTRMLHGSQQHRIAEKLAILDHHIDLSDVHVNDAASADVEMAHFAVAHLSVGQADITSGCASEGVGIFTQKLVICRLVWQRDAVGFALGAVSPGME